MQLSEIILKEIKKRMERKKGANGRNTKEFIAR
jgi:hypothetical protein